MTALFYYNSFAILYTRTFYSTTTSIATITRAFPFVICMLCFHFSLCVSYLATVNISRQPFDGNDSVIEKWLFQRERVHLCVCSNVS